MPAILRLSGKSILLADEPYTIIGVLGPGFTTDPPSDIWLAAAAGSE